VLDAHVIKVRPRFTVDAEVRVATGEACGLFGVSGSGKSTILSCIAGAEAPDGGHVALDGLVLFPPALPLHLRPIGYLTQDANLFPHLSVADNVRFGIRNGLRASHESWVDELRERLHLESIWREPAYAISGGQAGASRWRGCWPESPRSSYSTSRSPASTGIWCANFSARSPTGSTGSALRWWSSIIRPTSSRASAPARSRSNTAASSRTRHGRTAREPATPELAQLLLPL